MKILFFVCLLACVAFAKPSPTQLKGYIKTQSGFIVGGVAAVSGDAPHQVSLQHYSHFCGELLKLCVLHNTHLTYSFRWFYHF